MLVAGVTDTVTLSPVMVAPPVIESVDTVIVGVPERESKNTIHVFPSLLLLPDYLNPVTPPCKVLKFESLSATVIQLSL